MAFKTRQSLLALCRELKPLFFERFHAVASSFNASLRNGNTSLEPVWRPDNEGLYLLIHGLNGRPSVWHKHYRDLRALHPHAEVRAPYVPHKGHCALEEAAAPFIAFVERYITENPGKPVCIIGFSNGARIASLVEVSLRGMSSPMKVSAISGTYFGTKRVNMLDALKITGICLPHEVAEELRFGSEKVRALLERMRSDVERGLRTYSFFTSKNDHALKPFTTALPEMPLCIDTHYFVLEGYGHNGTIDAVREQQVHHCIRWMHSHLDNIVRDR